MVDMPDERLKGERFFVEQLVTEVRGVIQRALQVSVPLAQVEWTEMRWDTVDITASWPQDNTHRNIHGWVRGGWPAFLLQFEGSAWEDDERSLQRRVMFLSGVRANLTVVEGGTAHPKIEIPDRERVVKSVQELVGRLQGVPLKDAPWEYGLHPHPVRDSSPQA
jgi:hypothetical protein